MITGLHAILYSPDAEKVRAFLRDVLGWTPVDAGHGSTPARAKAARSGDPGWLIFAAPPAKVAAHPIEPGEKPHHELYLMCDDLEKTVAELKAKGVKCGSVTGARWGSVTSIQLPGGGELGLYQPSHPTALGLK